MRLWRHYENGHLLLAGGVGDQPNVYLEAMECLSTQVTMTARKAAERDAKTREAGLGGSGRARLKIR